MGIYHFMGVGRAVGAVTCAIDYVEKSLNILSEDDRNTEVKQLLLGSGGIKHKEEDIGKVEALVLFSSKEVINREMAAFSYEGCDKPRSVRDEIESQLTKTWKRYNPEQGRKIFWVEVDIDNYEDCFFKAMKVAYRFSPPGKQGKEIWLNLTGGSNAINLALVSMARLTGVSTKHYLLSQAKAYQKHTTVPPSIKIAPNKDKYFNVLPFIKLAVDTVNFYEILFELDDLNKKVSTKELYGRMCSRRVNFGSIKIDEFSRDYMLRLYGLGYTSYDSTRDETVIIDEGRSFLSDLKQLYLAIDLEELLESSNEGLVEESRKWLWLSTTILP